MSINRSGCDSDEEGYIYCGCDSDQQSDHPVISLAMIHGRNGCGEHERPDDQEPVKLEGSEVNVDEAMKSHELEFISNLLHDANKHCC